MRKITIRWPGSNGAMNYLPSVNSAAALKSQAQSSKSISIPLMMRKRNLETYLSHQYFMHHMTYLWLVYQKQMNMPNSLLSLLKMDCHSLTAQIVAIRDLASLRKGRQITRSLDNIQLLRASATTDKIWRSWVS